MNVCFILFVIFILNCSEAADEINVTVSPKQFIGLKTTVEGKEIDYFLGIPYAEPPIGKLRFKKPLPHKYNGAINATKWGNVCYQNEDISNALYLSHNMSEDCLYLNIWSPKISKELKPVLFFIHGGTLVTGTASFELSTGEILASRGDVVVVTINYRVQALGFLYTGTEDAPGNAGLWDQALALQWVKDNIETFGGDPQQVTIFGVSAGSWSVGLNILSPITRNLFKNAIMMSAGPLSHMTGEHPVKALENWLKVANFAECEGKNFSSTVIQCLQNISAEKLVKAAAKRELTTDALGVMAQATHGDQFLPQEPIQMLKRGDHKMNFRLIASFTDDEGTNLLANIDPIKYTSKTPPNMTKTQAFEELKQFSNKLINHFKPVNGEEVAKLYLSRLQNTDYDTIRRTVGIAFGDFYISCTTDLFAKALYENDRNHTKVYQYYFAAKQDVNALTEGYCAQWQGACHSSDMISVFGYPLKAPQYFSTQDQEVSKKIIDTFGHFAKNGYPPAQEGIEWPEYYTLNNNVVQHYYEFSTKPKPNGNFGYGLKSDECEKLWKPYIYG